MPLRNASTLLSSLRLHPSVSSSFGRYLPSLHVVLDVESEGDYAEVEEDVGGGLDRGVEVLGRHDAVLALHEGGRVVPQEDDDVEEADGAVQREEVRDPVERVDQDEDEGGVARQEEEDLEQVADGAAEEVQVALQAEQHASEQQQLHLWERETTGRVGCYGSTVRTPTCMRQSSTVW